MGLFPYGIVHHSGSITEQDIVLQQECIEIIGSLDPMGKFIGKVHTAHKVLHIPNSSKFLIIENPKCPDSLYRYICPFSYHARTHPCSVWNLVAGKVPIR